MPFAVGRLYVAKYFDEESKQAVRILSFILQENNFIITIIFECEKALEMIKHIQDEFVYMLDQNSWMDDESKLKAKEKVNMQTQLRP
jgi:predicted metalloendopeptidase